MNDRSVFDRVMKRSLALARDQEDVAHFFRCHSEYQRRVLMIWFCTGLVSSGTAFVLSNSTIGHAPKYHA